MLRPVIMSLSNYENVSDSILSSAIGFLSSGELFSGTYGFRLSMFVSFFRLLLSGVFVGQGFLQTGSCLYIYIYIYIHGIHKKCLHFRALTFKSEEEKK